MSLARRILLFPLTRLVIALVLFGVVYLFSSLLIASLVPQQFVQQLIVVPVVALAAVGTLIFVGAFIERRPLGAIGLRPGGAGRDLALGFALGASLISIVVGVSALAGWYHVTGVAPLEAMPLLALALLYTLLEVVFEETLFRGIVFRILEEGLGSWLALLLSALLFGLLHLQNPHATLASGLAIAVEAGVLLAAAYMLTRSLWLAIGIHCAWNFFEGHVFGASVSGTNGTSFLQSVTNGPQLWTGGSFGPEAGLVVLVACFTVGVVLLLLAARRGGVVTPQWLRRITETKHQQQAQPTLPG